MKNYYPSPILKMLIRRNLIEEKLGYIFIGKTKSYSLFLKEVWSNGGIYTTEEVSRQISKLLDYGFVSEIECNREKETGSLDFIEAVNFELTYKCQYSCPHCWQSGNGRNDEYELPTNKVKDAIFRAFMAGLCKEGINYTGGEILGNREDLFDILEYTNSLKIPYRINTNSWWATKKDFTICNNRFSSPSDLVAYLKSIGLKMFAFSFDERYKDNRLDITNLIESIKICEQAGLYYQVIFTGIRSKNINTLILDLQNICNIKLRHLIPVSMELVDVGNASDLSNDVYKWQSNKCSCDKRGFYRPIFLHINPEGLVRSCLYANGLANIGSLKDRSLTDLVNAFPYNPQNYSFSSDEIYEEQYNELVRPYLSVYKPIVHECTSNIILAKAIDMHNKSSKSSLKEVHMAIAREMNLLHQ